MMTSRERVRRALRFELPDRAPRELWALPGIAMFRRDEMDALLARYPSDFASPAVTHGTGPDVRYGTGYRSRGTPAVVGTYVDEWGCPFTVAEPGVIGEVNQGWTMAKFLLGNERVGVAPVGSVKRNLARAKEMAGPLLDDPLTRARIAELENELLALELTVLRVAAHSADGTPHPASSVLKLRGTELQQAVSELLVDLAGPASLASGADEDSSLPFWTHRAAPHYLNLRKASIYGGSNEIQRQIISGTILGL